MKSRTVAPLVVALGMGLCAPAPAAQTQTAEALQGAFIWSPSAPTGKQVYAVFRKSLELKERPKSATLHLFADSRYILWINGKYVNRGPCRFDPVGPEYDTLDVTQYLKPGANVLAATVHHYHDGKPLENGDGFCGRIMRHAPGLTAVLETMGPDGSRRSMKTDATWRVSTQNRFGPSPFTWTSIPDNVDARRDAGDWTQAEFDDSTWEKAVPVDGRQWGPLRARRIPLLRESEVGPLNVVLRQTGAAGPQILAGKPLLTKLLPLEMASRDQIVIDANRFVQAYVELDLEADAGSRLELEYAPAFFSAEAKTSGSPWLGTTHYTTRAGRQIFATSDTFGLKYLVVRCAAGKLRLLGVKLTNRLYPFDVFGKFVSSDPLLDAVWRIGVNTIQTCSEDAYVDCAVRERVEWLADAVMVAYPVSRLTMAGPGANGQPSWSDPRLFGNLLRHIGQSVQPDGRVKAHHPSNRWDIHGYIEDYSCLWIQSLRTWQENTGDLELVREMWPAATAQLKWFLDRRTERGLVRARDFVYPGGNPLCYQICEGATLNAFVARALADAAALAQLLGDGDRQRQYADASQAIQKAINAHLWDEKAGTYHGGIKDDRKMPVTVHAAGICLYFDVVPPQRRKSVEQWFLANLEREGCLPYVYSFYFEVLSRMDSEQSERLALDVIRRRWGPMAQFETQTTWEGFGPGENCHEAGAVPTIYLSRHVLGVGVDGPVADRRLVIQPRLGDLERAEGIVVTEFGPVPIRWNRTGHAGGLDGSVEIPAGVTARVFIPRPSNAARLLVDGQPAALSAESSASSFAVMLAAGKRALRVEP